MGTIGHEQNPFGVTAVTASKGNLKERLARYRQIKISVIGRKSGQTISIPIRREMMNVEAASVLLKAPTMLGRCGAMR